MKYRIRKKSDNPHAWSRFMGEMMRFLNFQKSIIRPALILGMLSSLPISAGTEVKSLEDLKVLQSQVTKVVEKALPATISLNSSESGASGSGVIISESGLILTAAHVVQGSEEMFVIFPDGKHARAKVLGAHYTRDSAMMKIIDDAPEGGWPYVEIGTSKVLDSGDYVVAMGHPGGYDPLRTPPVRFGRVIGHALEQFFSTDCSIIGGDSGGPLFNLDGELVGIHSSIGYSLSSNNHAGINGFLQDWEKLMTGEHWGQLGATNILADDSPVLGIGVEALARDVVGVGKVFEGSPAEKAGFRRGDIVQSINDRKITNLKKLFIELSKYKPGDKVKVKLGRQGKDLESELTLGSRAEVLQPNRR